MNIAIIHLYPFPIGMAATNRILAYSKGMIANGANVKVFCLNPYYKKGLYNIEQNGIYDGVPYEYFTNQYRSNNSIKHKFQFVYSIIKSYFRLKKEFKENKIDCLIISSEKPFLLKMYSSLAKKYKKKSIFIFDEYPSCIRYTVDTQIINKTREKYNKALKDTTAFVSIVELLADFYNKDLQKKCLIFPTITDISKFPDEKDVVRSKNICYMGSLDLQKDNVQLIVEAFAKIHKKYDGLQFHIYGKSNAKDKKILEDTIAMHNLQDKIILKGPVSFEKVPGILSSSIMLVSSQVNSQRIKGGLSTKLGEYLYSATPVLLSDVGWIKDYVNDGEHLFLAEPGNVDKYAEKMEMILQHYDRSLSIAKNGRQYIIENSSHIVMGNNLLNFINQLL